jgi:hypothetical protein
VQGEYGQQRDRHSTDLSAELAGGLAEKQQSEIVMREWRIVGHGGLSSN